MAGPGRKRRTPPTPTQDPPGETLGEDIPLTRLAQAQNANKKKRKPTPASMLGELDSEEEGFDETKVDPASRSPFSRPVPVDGSEPLPTFASCESCNETVTKWFRTTALTTTPSDYCALHIAGKQGTFFDGAANDGENKLGVTPPFSSPTTLTSEWVDLIVKRITDRYKDQLSKKDKENRHSSTKLIGVQRYFRPELLHRTQTWDTFFAALEAIAAKHYRTQCVAYRMDPGTDVPNHALDGSRGPPGTCQDHLDGTAGAVIAAIIHLASQDKTKAREGDEFDFKGLHAEFTKLLPELFREDFDSLGTAIPVDLHLKHATKIHANENNTQAWRKITTLAKKYANEWLLTHGAKKLQSKGKAHKGELVFFRIASLDHRRPDTEAERKILYTALKLRTTETDAQWARTRESIRGSSYFNPRETTEYLFVLPSAEDYDKEQDDDERARNLEITIINSLLRETYSQDPTTLAVAGPSQPSATWHAVLLGHCGYRNNRSTADTIRTSFLTLTLCNHVKDLDPGAAAEARGRIMAAMKERIQGYDKSPTLATAMRLDSPELYSPVAHHTTTQPFVHDSEFETAVAKIMTMEMSLGPPREGDSGNMESVREGTSAKRYRDLTNTLRDGFMREFGEKGTSPGVDHVTINALNNIFIPQSEKVVRDIERSRGVLTDYTRQYTHSFCQCVLLLRRYGATIATSQSTFEKQLFTIMVHLLQAMTSAYAFPTDSSLYGTITSELEQLCETAWCVTLLGDTTNLHEGMRVSPTHLFRIIHEAMTTNGGALTKAKNTNSDAHHSHQLHFSLLRAALERYHKM
jgi:hypothetical protein